MPISTCCSATSPAGFIASADSSPYPGAVAGDDAARTRWQRAGRRRVARLAGRRSGDALSPEDWQAYLIYSAQPSSRAIKRLLHTLPSSPRCGFCGAPFSGFGAKLIAPLGYRPSEKNPNICSTCVEMSPPGGMTTEVGVLFADLRGFTTLSERAGSDAATNALRTFYATAEAVFFPKALIDKVVGDEVMAVYLPFFIAASSGISGLAPREEVASMMVGHARELLQRMATSAPGVGVGVGLAFGEAYFGHVGSGAVRDFTVVGDVVNTASRLQGAAAPGEIVLGANLASVVDAPLGDVEQLTVKGKEQPVPVHRIRASAS
jgi:adenylate cyclase